MTIPDLFSLTTSPHKGMFKPMAQQTALTATSDDKGAALNNKPNSSIVENTTEPRYQSSVQVSEAGTGEEFQTFLTLLTAQIRNQDPLAPLDSTQFVEQLATFTNLELQAKGNQTLDTISVQLAQQLYAIQSLTASLPQATEPDS